MGNFKLGAENWPFILVLLLSMLGWFFVQLVDEVRSGTVVLYAVDVDRQQKLYTVTIENSSTRKAIPTISFMIKCENGTPCLERDAPETGKVDVPPNKSGGRVWSGDAHSLRATISIAPGGALRLRAKFLDAEMLPEFSRPASADDTTDVYVIERASRRGFLVRHYVMLLVLSAAMTLVAFLLLLRRLSGRTRRRGSTSTTGASSASPPIADKEGAA